MDADDLEHLRVSFNPKRGLVKLEWKAIGDSTRYKLIPVASPKHREVAAQSDPLNY